MSKALSLAKIYISSTYGIKRFFRNLKYNKKDAIKSAGLFFLILLSLSSFFGMMLYSYIRMYDFLGKIDQQGLIVTISIIFASFFTFILGMITVITGYFMNQEGDIILSLPLRKRDILLAKYINSYVTELIASAVVMGIGLGVYGVKSNEGILFYLILVIASLLVPIIPLVLCYLIVIPLMKIGNLTKKKDLLMILSGLLVLPFAIGYQYLINKVLVNNNPQYLIEFLTKQNGLIDVFGRVYYLSILLSKGILGYNTFQGILYIIAFLILSVSFVYLLLILMSKIYYSSIIGGNEINKKYYKLNKSENNKIFKSRGIISTLLLREIKLMNREPIYLLNGPLVIFLLPVMMYFVLLFNKESMKEITVMLSNKDIIKHIGIYGGIIILFLGISTSITSTCISREGKGFYFLKSLPIKAEQLILAKFLHGAIFGAIGGIMVCCLMAYFKIPIISIIIAFLIGNILLFDFYIIGIIIDFKWPKLNWDNPQKAMKQNINPVILILLSMGVMGVSFAVISKIKVPSSVLEMVYIGISGIILIVLYIYIKRNINQMIDNLV
ncbi:Putative ATP-binding cassette [Caloramator quimbayensis]|uniref:Putative ATP-binding cassette n=1 Tax=Caloramator quimbayensis TaxID=1147123 RepID=A0A1T4YHQ6_9CLOT|nr:hypothetical protein [Caloramator quimbayensis]SKB00755.1 Putative ATP-binding cassette [Caloramator quimbayensis]